MCVLPMPVGRPGSGSPGDSEDEFESDQFGDKLELVSLATWVIWHPIPEWAAASVGSGT